MEPNVWSGFWVRPWQFIATHPVPKTRRMVCVSLLVMNVVNYIFIRLQGHKSWTFVYSIKCSIIQCTHVYSFCKSKTESKVSLSKFYGPQVKHDKQYMYFSQRIKRYGFINISGTLIFVDFAVEGILKIPSINHQNQMSLALSVLLIVNSFWNDVDIKDALVLPACCSTGVCTFILKHTELFFSIYRPKSEYSELEEDVRKYRVNGRKLKYV